MADIRIEKKKPVWPWVILIIILAVLVFLYFYGSTESNEDDMQDTEISMITTMYMCPILDNDVGRKT